MKRLLIKIAVLLGLLASPTFAKKRIKPEEPTATLKFLVVKDENGKPVRNAAVVLHPVNDKDKQERGGLELKSDAEGKCSIDGIPYGKLRVQVLASGYQTYGGDYEVGQDTVEITLKLKRPNGQYSIYVDHPEEKKDEAPPTPK